MTGTADDRNGESFETSGAQRYFRALEESFLALRGAPFLLSPADWRVAKSWYEAGIPLEVVEETMRELFRRRRERDPDSTVSGLRYFDRAVRGAWRAREEARGPDFRRAPAEKGEELDLEKSLMELSERIPRDLPGGPSLARRVRSLSGAPPAVEEELRRLDEEMVARARKELESGDREILERRTEESLRPLEERHGEEELESLREQLRRRHLREMLKLPVLSLFG